MRELENYINKDVVFHFSELLNDLDIGNLTLMVFSKEIYNTINEFDLRSLIPRNIKLKKAPGLIPDKRFIDNILELLKDEKTILTVKKEWLSIEQIQKAGEAGADIRIVDDILGSMIVASKKRRNNVIFPIDGFEDEALITAAGLAKAKTVGFKRFFVLQNHLNTPELIKSISAESDENIYYLLPLKTGLNTGSEKYSEIPLLYKRGVVFSGYEVMEIMQSIYMLAGQFSTNTPKVLFQRTKEVNDEITARARWMIEEVFDNEDYNSEEYGIIKNGKMKINDKYSMFDAVRLLDSGNIG